MRQQMQRPHGTCRTAVHAFNSPVVYAPILQTIRPVFRADKNTFSVRRKRAGERSGGRRSRLRSGASGHRSRGSGGGGLEKFAACCIHYGIKFARNCSPYLLGKATTKIRKNCSRASGLLLFFDRLDYAPATPTRWSLTRLRKTKWKTKS